MRTIHWELMGSVLGQALFNITVMTAIVTLFGTAALKYFARSVPWLSHAFIFFWAMFRVMLVVLVITFVGVIFDIPTGPLSGVFTFLGIGAVGTLITRNLGKHYGLPTKFPAIGAKTMFVLFILIWVIVIVVYLLSVEFKMP